MRYNRLFFVFIVFPVFTGLFLMLLTCPFHSARAEQSSSQIEATEKAQTPGLRLPYSRQDARSIRVEESFGYRHPADVRNRDAVDTYSVFDRDCREYRSDGDNEKFADCVAHFPDFDRGATIPHRATDYVSIRGGRFPIYAGVPEGTVYDFSRQRGTSSSSVTVQTVLRGKTYYVEYSHLDPTEAADTYWENVSELAAQQGTVTYDTLIGITDTTTHQDSTTIWTLDGTETEGYCIPDKQALNFLRIGGVAYRCYPAHVDYRVGTTPQTWRSAVDPYDICQAFDGKGKNCQAYAYPGNRFGTTATSLGAEHLWELDSAGAIRVATDTEVMVQGQVLSPEGEALQDAVVVALQQGTTLLQTVTTPDGWYVFADDRILPGVADITAYMTATLPRDYLAQRSLLQVKGQYRIEEGMTTTPPLSLPHCDQSLVGKGADSPEAFRSVYNQYGSEEVLGCPTTSVVHQGKTSVQQFWGGTLARPIIVQGKGGPAVLIQGYLSEAILMDDSRYGEKIPIASTEEVVSPTGQKGRVTAFAKEDVYEVGDGKLIAVSGAFRRYAARQEQRGASLGFPVAPRQGQASSPFLFCQTFELGEIHHYAVSFLGFNWETEGKAGCPVE